MGSLGLIYDALPRHTGALTGEPAAAAWLVRVAMATGDPRRADAVVDAAEGIAWRNPPCPDPRWPPATRGVCATTTPTR